MTDKHTELVRRLRPLIYDLERIERMYFGAGNVYAADVIDPMRGAAREAIEQLFVESLSHREASGDQSTAAPDATLSEAYGWLEADARHLEKQGYSGQAQTARRLAKSLRELSFNRKVDEGAALPKGGIEAIKVSITAPDAGSETPETDNAAWSDDYHTEKYVSADLARSLERRLRALEKERNAAAGQWVRVKDKLPELNHKVLVATYFGAVRQGELQPHYWVVCDYGKMTSEAVIHWMLLPAAPQGKDEG